MSSMNREKKKGERKTNDERFSLISFPSLLFPSIVPSVFSINILHLYYKLK
jgi:hypothetical protein